jgi:hypothetical protein
MGFIPSSVPSACTLVTDIIVIAETSKVEQQNSIADFKRLFFMILNFIVYCKIAF